jgi:hypothetical protein
MPSNAVDQHERMIGRQPAQRERPHDLRRVRHRLLREVDRRGERREHLGCFRGARALNVFHRVHIHGHRQLLGRGVSCARADDDVHRGELLRGVAKDDVGGRHLPRRHHHGDRLRREAERSDPHHALSGGNAVQRVRAARRGRGSESGLVDGDRRTDDDGTAGIGDPPLEGT